MAAVVQEVQEEGETEYVYAVVRQRDCDDTYYPPYHDVLAMYKNLERAIEDTRARAHRMYDPEDPEEKTVHIIDRYQYADTRGYSHSKVVFVMINLDEEVIE
jgi:hypothetical protein